VFLGAPINDQVANLIVAQLLWLDREDSDREIQLHINCPGGEVNAGFAIYDTMQLIKSPVSTFAVGMTASFGTVVLASGTKGKRYAMPNATIHMHQPHGGSQGQASDLLIQANEIIRKRELLNQIFSERTGQPKEVIERDTDRDFYLTAKQALDYGLIDAILAPVPVPARYSNGNGNGKH
jgi:ATP-dependent Clp protease protease subunit